MSADPSRGYRRSPTDVDREIAAGTTVVLDAAVVAGCSPAAVVDGADVEGAGADAGAVTGAETSGVRWESRATGSAGVAQAASSDPHTTATTASERARVSAVRTGSGTAARYRADKCHKPRQSSTETCKVCSRSSSGRAAAPMSYP